MAIDSKTLEKYLPALQQLDARSKRELLAHAQIHTLPAGNRLFYEGESCKRFLLVLKGSLRVQKLTDNGHEIVLYHVGQGQSCKLTNTCLLGGQRYPAEAFAESEVELLSLPKAVFERLLAENPAFRTEIFASIDVAMSDLVRLVQEVAFGHLDHRLAQLLLQRSQQEMRLRTTHQALATELGTAREVVSRLLKEFERNGWLRLHRGSMEIIDRVQLACL